MSQYPYETDDWRDAFEVTQPMPDFPPDRQIPAQNPYFQQAPTPGWPNPVSRPVPDGAQPLPPQSLQHPRMPHAQSPAPAISEVLGGANEAASPTQPPIEHRRPRPQVQHDFPAPEVADAYREPIAVPDEFLSPPRRRRAAPAPEQAANPESATPAADLTEPGGSRRMAAASTATNAPKAPAKPDKPDDGGFSAGPPKWQDHVPFDETGVLMRPESLRHHAMQAETELMKAIKLDKDDGPEDGSDAAKSQRPSFWTGAWPRRALLAAILLVQAILSLRNNNSPFEDESLYLYSGHLELGHMMYGTSTISNFWTEFSGAPVFYPIVGAVADQLGGILAARLLSLLFMLATTGLLYAVTRRLFGTRAALSAAALYSCGEATIFLGGLATYDAPALFLIALSVWIVVRFARNGFPIYLLAVFPAAIAVGTKYVSLLFVPSIVVLAFLVSLPYLGRWSVIRPIALTIGLSTVVYAMYKAAGPSGAAGISFTTTSRAQGTDSVATVLMTAVEWGAGLFAVSLIGAVCVIRLPRRHPHSAIPGPGWQRVSLVLLLVGTALLAPAYQAHLHTTISLQKHVGFGLFFAAPLAGYGLVRLVGAHLHRAQLGIGLLVLNLALGMTQSLYIFHSWPNSYAMVAELVRYQQPDQHYFVGNASNAIYQLRGDPDAQPWQFTDAFYFQYEVKPGVEETGDVAYADAIKAGYFRVIAYDFSADGAVESSVAEDLYHSESYVMVARIPSPTSGGPGYAYVWVRKW